MKKKAIKFICMLLAVALLLPLGACNEVAKPDDEGGPTAYEKRDSSVVENGGPDLENEGDPDIYTEPDLGTSVQSIAPSGAMIAEYSEDYPGGYYEEPPFNTEEYSNVDENGFRNVSTSPTSTFSASVDTASYANLRRMINNGYGLEDFPTGAIRIEEFLNYFSYDFITPRAGEPFAMSAQIADCPWNKDTRLLILGLQAQNPSTTVGEGSNLVFLIDVSGSMENIDKLPLLKKSFSYLIEQLNPSDRVSIVTYAGNDRVVLEGAYASEKNVILDAIDNLSANGSTAGAKGLKRAYEIAEKYYIEGGNNRIIMASDGDLNVGFSSESELADYVSTKRETGVYLSVLGFGSGNYKDNKMKAIAQNGNGNYHYIDCIEEAQKVFGEDLTANLYSVADDVKIELEFNPAYIKGYRLIGYETRQLTHEDFTDDTKDAAELGAGHQVIVAYEIVMKDSPFEIGGAPLKYQEQAMGIENGDWFTISIRYKEPGTQTSKEVMFPFGKSSYTDSPDQDWVFASAVIEFGMIASQSDFVGTATLEEVIERAGAAEKSNQYRREFVQLVERLVSLSR